jgi:hypothetical protein
VQDTVEAGAEGVRRLTEEVTRAFGPKPELARKATENMQAITETGSVLLRGFQDLNREWIELAQHRFQRNAESFTKLAQCRNMQDFTAIQSELVRENLQDAIDSTRRFAELSLKIADDAARFITAETRKAADRVSRAA